MAYDGVMDDVNRAVALEKPKRIPVFACSEEFDVKWYGKYPYEEVCQSGDKLAEVWSAAIDEFDYDWAWLQIDDCFEFEPLGVGTRGEGDILRATTGYLPATTETLDSLKIPDCHSAGRIPEKLKAIELIRKRYGDSVMVVGSGAAPYTAVGLTFGLEETMMLGLGEPELLKRACDFFVEWESAYCTAQIDAGAHAIWLGDCNCFSVMLSLDQYKQFAFEACKTLVDRIHAAGGLAYLHNSEIQVPYLTVETELGVDIVNCGPAANMNEVRPALTGKGCFSGNLDPIEVLMRGTPEQVASEADRLVKLCAPAGGYVFCTGEMNPRDTPAANMKAMIAAARRAGEEVL